MTAPLVKSLTTSIRGPYQLELKGQINPNGLIVNYYFEYDSDINFGTSTFTPTQGLPNDTEYLEVKYVIGSLIADTPYYYRLIAINVDGTSVSNTITTATTTIRFSSPEFASTVESQQFKLTPIYRDFNQFTPDKNPFVYNVGAVGQGIHNILHCAERQRFFKNAFGSKIGSLPFELLDDETVDLAYAYVAEPIAIWEPRAYLDGNTDVIADPDNHVLGLSVVFGLVEDTSKLYTLKVKQ